MLEVFFLSLMISFCFVLVIPLILFVLLKLGCPLRSLTLDSQYLIICYSALIVIDMVAVLQSLLSQLFLYLPLPFASNLEFLPLLITSLHHSFTLGTFYKPPNSDSAFGLFKDHISFLSPTILHNLILVGDFNIDLLKSSSLSKSLIDFTKCLGLNQIICEPTHFSHTGSPSLIDLVFVSSDLSCPSRVLPPISSFDHLSILFSLPLVRKDPDPHPTNGCKVWLYNKADLHSAN